MSNRSEPEGLTPMRPAEGYCSRKPDCMEDTVTAGSAREIARCHGNRAPITRGRELGCP